jgi:hypothetical protein
MYANDPRRPPSAPVLTSPNRLTYETVPLQVLPRITAWVALSQFARQTRQLERRQADEIDVVMVPSDVRLPGYPDMQHRPETWMVEVSNGSRRPV